MFCIFTSSCYTKCFMTIAEFLTYLKHEKRYSPHTIQSYETDLLQFEAYLSDVYELALPDAGRAQVRDYMVWLMERQIAERSVARKLSALRSFYKHLVAGGAIASSPMALVRAPKVPNRLPVFVEDHKLDQLLDSTEIFNDSFSSVRDKLVIEMLFGTGMRVSELVNVKLQDVDFYASSVKVLGKRNKERIIPIGKTLTSLLKVYIDTKTLQDFNNKTEYLFVTNKGAAVTRGFIYKIVTSYLTYVSTQDKKSPHVLRHSYATSLLNRGADLNAIKELLGHASLAATQVYTHNSIERLKSIYKQAHPKA